MKNFFTSDWHLGHEKMLRGVRGSKFNSVEEHDNTVINNILEITKPGDNLYFLGDAFWKYTSQQVQETMIKFKKHRINLFWILGNHDKISWTKFGVVKWAGQIKDITIEKQLITLCHYPMLVYHRSHYGGMNLYGHIHIQDHTWNVIHGDPITRNFHDFFMGKALNVNVELHDYKPLEFEQVLEAVRNKPENFDLIRRNN